MAEEHLKYGGSAIERTMLCPGSVAAIAAIPDRKAGPAAERGTRIHKWLEKYLTGDYAKDAKKAKGKDAEEVKIAAESGLAIKNVATELGFAPVELVVEKKVVMTQVSHLAGGTPDVYAARAFGDLLVVDLKTGNRFVDADENLQLLFYAVAILNNLDSFLAATLVNAHLVIVQPEQEAPYKVRVQKWSCPVSKLIEYQNIFKAAIERAEANPTERVPGDHCEGKYCDARTTCHAYQDWLNTRSLGLFAAAVGGEKLASPVAMADLAKLLEIEPLFTALFKQVKEDAEAALQADGNSVPGWMLVDKYANRAWVSPADTIKRAKELGLTLDEYNPRELVSPAQFEKLLKAKNLKAELPRTVNAYAGVKLTKAKDTPQTALAALAAAAQETQAAPPELDFASLI